MKISLLSYLNIFDNIHRQLSVATVVFMQQVAHDCASEIGDCMKWHKPQNTGAGILIIESIH